jgi:hypothetical protein
MLGPTLSTPGEARRWRYWQFTLYWAEEQGAMVTAIPKCHLCSFTMGTDTLGLLTTWDRQDRHQSIVQPPQKLGIRHMDQLFPFNGRSWKLKGLFLIVWCCVRSRNFSKQGSWISLAASMKSSFAIKQGVGDFQLVARFLTKGIFLWIVPKLVC